MSGVLSLDCALFVWDQCVLLGWADVLPLYAAACLLAMRREIKAATTVRYLRARGLHARVQYYINACIINALAFIC